MDIEKRLKKFKKIYLEAEPSADFMEHGWSDLQNKLLRLDKFQIKRSFYFYYFRPFAFTVMVIVILSSVTAGIVTASFGSLPGEPLYPIKRLSEDMAERAGNNVVRVENRAKEIVELSKKGSSVKEVQKAVAEYKTVVSEASRSGKNVNEIEKKLEEQEKEFEQLKNGSSEKEIDEAIEISRSGRGNDQEDEEKDEEDDRSGSNSGSNN